MNDYCRDVSGRLVIELVLKAVSYIEAAHIVHVDLIGGVYVVYEQMKSPGPAHVDTRAYMTGSG